MGGTGSKAVEYLKRRLEEIGAVRTAGPGPVFDKWQLDTSTLLTKIDPANAERFDNIRFESNQLIDSSDTAWNEQNAKEALAKGLDKALAIIEHVIDKEERDLEVDVSVAPAIHPNDAARRVLALFYKVYEQRGLGNWFLIPENEAFEELDLGQRERAFELLRAKSLLKVFGQRQSTITTDGVNAMENPATLDRLLPLPKAPTTVQSSEAPKRAEVDVSDLVALIDFVGEPLRTVIISDLGELASALTHKNHKSTMLLCGSILEGVLLDILGRKPNLADSMMPKNKTFPDDASLKMLIDIASDKELISADHILLTQTTKGLGITITDHRDLIHPQKQIRDKVVVDGTSARSMVHILELVIRDLKRAADGGAITAYEAK